MSVILQNGLLRHDQLVIGQYRVLCFAANSEHFISEFNA